MTHPTPRALRPPPGETQLNAFHTTGTSPSAGRPSSRRRHHQVLRGLAPLPARWRTWHGHEIAAGTVAFEACGPPDAPTVVVLGGISAGRHVTSSALRPAPGWWETIVGPGKALDTARLRVVGIDYLGGPGASTRLPAASGAGLPFDGEAARLPGSVATGPPSAGDDSAGATLPDTRDQAVAVHSVLRYLGVGTAHAVVGSSYGGMVGLAFAAAFPEATERFLCISAAHRSHPMATALRGLQRRIVGLGRSGGQEAVGLALARGLAMTTYRTAREFETRFPATPTRGDTQPRFAVERYLDARGARFVDAFDADAFLALSLSLDVHRIEPAEVTTPTTVVAVDGDSVVPVWLATELVERLGGPSRLVRIESVYGHDAFLKETAAVTDVIEDALSTVRGSS